MLKLLRKRIVRRGLVSVLGLLALLVLAAFFFPQQVLCVDSGDVQADALVVLGGGSYERPTRAADLFLSGVAPRIIVSGAGDAERSKQFLASKGVPPAAIELEGKSRSTKQNAQFSIPLLRGEGGKAETLKAEMLKLEGRRAEGGGQQTEDGGRRTAGAKRVIIVTSWYHSRRALRTFQHYAPDMQFYSRPSYYGYPRAQWSRKGISGDIRAEYVKLAGYWVCYGVCPF
jgi:uncharacterized SAM-binding protein YcdF (DUF218 family)